MIVYVIVYIFAKVAFLIYKNIWEFLILPESASKTKNSHKYELG